jgi:C-terminal processing protease CtpA/Prc
MNSLARFILVAFFSLVAIAKPSDAPLDVFNGRWNLIFELPDSLPYSQVIMPFEFSADPNGKVNTIALGGPGVSLPEGQFRADRLEMKGTSIFGPITLNATVTGNRLQGQWAAGSFNGEVKGEKIESRSSKEGRMAVFDEVWSQVDQQFFDPQFNGVDWKSVGATYRPHVASSGTDGQMSIVIREMLNELHSSHVGFYALSPEESLVSRPSKSDDKTAPITWKKLTDQVGYLRVTRFDEGADVVQLVDRGFSEIGSLPWVIVDLRGNAGGTLTAAMRLADFIFREPRLVGFLATREGLKHYKVDAIDQLRIDELPIYGGHNVKDFFEALRKTGAIALRTGGQGNVPFPGRVVMLMDENSASTAEALLSMVKEAKAATLIGRRTAGALLSARDMKVSGGWTLRIPEANFRTFGGVNVEGRGVEPDIAVDKSDGEDAELKRALEFIRKQQP